jgi:hypothetical protein
MGIRYNGVKLTWLRQNTNSTTTVSWTTASNLGTTLGGSTVSIPLRVLVISGVGETTFSVISGSLPSGLTIDGSNNLSGVLTNTGATYTFTIRATNGAVYADQTFTFIAEYNNPPVWNTPSGNLGSQYEGFAGSFQLSAYDPESQPITFVLEAGSLPYGLTLTNTGLLSGTLSSVTANTGFSFTIAASDGIYSTNQSFSFTTLADPVPVWQGPFDFGDVIATTTFTKQLEANSVNPLTYSLASGTLPAGLTLSNSGLINGVVSATAMLYQDFYFTVNASDGYKANSAQFHIALLKNSPPTWVSSGIIIQNEGGNFANTTLVANSAFASIGATVSYDLANYSTLPGDFNLLSNGLLYGHLPVVASQTDYLFDAIAADGYESSTRTFRIRDLVNQPPIWNTSAGPLSNAIFEAQPYSITVSAYDVNGQTITYSLANGTSLPSGLFLNTSNGLIYGTTPIIDTATTYNFTIAANNGLLATTRDFSQTVDPVEGLVWVTPAGNLYANVAGTTFSTTVSAIASDNGTVSYSLSSGSLPTGVTFTNTGVLSGTLPAVTNTTTYTITLAARETGSNTIHRTFSFESVFETAPTWVTNAGALANTSLGGTAYNIALNAVDSTVLGRAITFSLANGSSLPSGLNLLANGLVTGTLPIAGNVATYNFTVQAFDGYDYTSRTFSQTVNPLSSMPVWYTTTNLGTFAVNSTVNIQLNANSPLFLPLTYSLNSSSLPGTLSLSNSGYISGTLPYEANPSTFMFSVLATDGANSTARTFSLSETGAPPVWTTNTNLLAYANAISSISLSVISGEQPIVYSLVNSTALPANLSLITDPYVSNVSVLIHAEDAINSTTVTDSSGKNTFTLGSNAVISTAKAEAGNSSIYINGPSCVSSEVNPVGLNFGTNDFTLEAWIYPQNLSSDSGQFVPGRGPYYGAIFNLTSGDEGGNDRGLLFYINSTSPTGNASVIGLQSWNVNSFSNNPIIDAIANTTIAFNTWTHVAVTRSSGTLNFFVNGIEQTTSYPSGSAFTSSTVIPYATNCVFNIGATNGGLGSPYNETLGGYLDEIRVTNGVARYTSNFTPPAIIGTGGTIYGQWLTTANSTANFTIRATDVAGNYSDRSFTLTALSSLPYWTESANLGNQFGASTFSTTISANDPEGLALTYSLSNGSTLPGSLVLNSNGLISGTLPVVNSTTTYNFTVIANNSVFETANETFSITARPGIITWVSSANLGNFTVNSAISNVTLSATDTNNLSLTYSLANATSLPSGLSLSNGVIFGKPTIIGSNSFVISASDAVGAIAYQTFNVAVVSGTISWTNTSFNYTALSPISNVALSSLVSDTDHSTLVFTVSNSTSLPAGLTLSNGVISGTPTTPASTSFSLEAIDAYGAVSFKTYNAVVSSPSIVWTDSTSISVFANTAYSYQLTANNGFPITYSLNSGTLPASLTLSNTGLLSGTLGNTASMSSYTITASDSYGKSLNRSFVFNTVVNINPVWLTTALPTGVDSHPYSVSIANYAIDPQGLGLTYTNLTPLPGSLQLLANGLVYGSLPSVANTYSFTVSATDTNSANASANVTLITTVNHAPVWVTNSVGQYYLTLPISNTVLSAVDPDGDAVTYAISNSTSLPAGLVLTGNTISGTPTTLQYVTFTVSASDPYGAVSYQTFTTNITAVPPVWFTSPVLGPLSANVALNLLIQAQDPLGNPLSYAVTNGTSLPTGLTLSNSIQNTAVITGTPTAISNNTFVIGAFDSIGNAVSYQTFYANVVAQQSSNGAFLQLTDPYGNTTYSNSATLTTVGQWTVKYLANTLTTVVANGASGGISSGEAAAGGSAFANGIITNGTTHIVWVGGAGNSYTGNVFTNFGGFGGGGRVGVAASGVSAPTTGGGLSGIFLNSPSQANALLIAGGAGGTSVGSGVYAIGGTGGGLTGGGANSIQGWSGAPGTQTAGGAGGRIGGTAGGALQGGYGELSDTSIYSTYSSCGGGGGYWGGGGGGNFGNLLDEPGTETGAGGGGSGYAANFWVANSLTTGAGAGGGLNGNVTIVAATLTPPVWVSNTNLGSHAIGSSVSIQLLAAAEVSNETVTYALTSGSLPSGLSLSNTGLISGITPTILSNTNVYNFTVSATTFGISSNQTFTFNVSTPAIVWTDNTSVSAYETTAYSYQLTANNGFPISYSLNSGSLPASLTLSNTGLLSGTLSNTVGTSNYTITAADSYGTSLNRSFTFTELSAAPTWVTNASLGSYSNDGTISIQLSATSPLTNTIVYSLASGSLPTGISLSNAGLLSGTLPTINNTASYSFTLAATSNGLSTQQTFTLGESGGPPVWTSNATLSGYANSNVSYHLVATSPSQTPISYNISNGTLPTALVIGADQYWSNVSTLLHFDDPTSNTTLFDPTGLNTWSLNAASISNAVVKFGSSSVFVGTGINPSTQANPVGFNFSSAPFTIESWIYPLGWGDDSYYYGGEYNGVVAKLFDSNQTTWQFMVRSLTGANGTSLAMQGYGYYGGSGAPLIDVYANTTVPLNQWSHVAVSRSPTNASTFYFFLNGTLLTTGSRTNGGQTPILTVANAAFLQPVNGSQVIIGGTGGGGAYSDSLYGYIDELRITNNVCRYTSSFTPQTSAYVANGYIVGTLTSSVGAHTFTVEAIDAIGLTANQVTTLNVLPSNPVWNSTVLPSGIDAHPYSNSIAGFAVDPQGLAITYTNTTALPGTLTLSANGLVSGYAPNIANTYSFRVTATNSIPLSAQANVTLTTTINHAPVWVSNTILGPYTALVSISNTTVLNAVDPDGDIVTYTVSNSTSLPAGLNLAANGLIYGAPTVSGNNFTFTVSASDSYGGVAYQTFTANIGGSPPVWVTNAVLGPLSANVALNLLIQAQDPFGYSISYGVANGTSLPAGLTLSNSIQNTAVITGTPTNISNNTFIIGAYNSTNSVSYKTFYANVVAQQSSNGALLQITDPYGNTNYSNSATMTTVGQWTVTYLANVGITAVANGAGGGAAGGYALANGGVTNGTTHAIWVGGKGGTYSTSTGVFGPFGGGGAVGYNPINAQVGTGGGLSGIFLNSPSQANALLIAGGGGGSINSSDGDGIAYGGQGGGINGGFSQFGNDNGSTGGAVGTQTSGGASGGNTFGGSALQGGAGMSNSLSIYSANSGCGGGGGYWGGGAGSATSNVAGPGGGGGGSGYAAGNTVWTANTLTTGKGAGGSTNGNVTIVANLILAPIWVSNTGFAFSVNTVVVNASVLATDPAGLPLNYVLANSTSLPTGISLAANGVITGKPTAPGTTSFVIEAIDSFGAFSYQNFNAVVSSPAIVWTDNTTVSAYETTTYSYQLTANNGYPITYSLNSGSLPASLTLSNTGLLSGTLSNSVNVSNYTITAADAYGTTLNRSFSFSVLSEAPVWISNSNLGLYSGNSSVNIQLVANAPISSVKYSLASGTLPSGISLSNSGLLSGFTPSVSNPTLYNFTINASANSFVTPQSFTLSVSASGPVWTSNSSLLTAGNGIVNLQLSALDTGGNYPISYSISNGSLPSGLSLGYGANVTMMIHAQDPLTNTILYDSTGLNTYTLGNASISTAQKKFGNSSIYSIGIGNNTITSSQLNPVGMPVGNGAFTIEAWIYPQSLSVAGNGTYPLGYSSIGCIFNLYQGPNSLGLIDFFICGPSTTNATVMALQGGSAGGNGNPTVIDCYANAVVPFNQWSHVAVSRSGANVYFFLNGVQYTTVYRTTYAPTFTASTAIQTAANNKVQIGGSQGVAGYWQNFGGYIEEIRVTNGTAQYIANFTPQSYAFTNQFIQGTVNSVSEIFSFTARATDSIGLYADQATTLVVDSAPYWLSATLPTATVSNAYSTNLSSLAVDPEGSTLTYANTTVMPTGLNLLANGLVYGTIATSGSYTFSTKATNTLS